MGLSINHLVSDGVRREYFARFLMDTRDFPSVVVHIKPPFGGPLTHGLECGGRSQRLEFDGEAQGAEAEGLSQLPQELLAKPLAEEAHGKKEGVFAARHPARTIGRDASIGHDAIQMGMTTPSPTIP